ncbi:MAG: hypothetical protein MJ010_04285 [Paludibacteraceae bacterium]|nr:hypothetical protein [Paludibacteraceae bacterium]
MKKLLFLGIVVLMVESLGAVTLPSTSYSPYSASPTSDGSFTTTGGTMVTGSYSTLRSGECPYGTTEDCETCCYNALGIAECEAGCETQACVDQCYIDLGYKSCVDECIGRSMPLDGGLSILLILSVAGGAVKLLRNRKV